jgi:hypothetical protein
MAIDTHFPRIVEIDSKIINAYNIMRACMYGGVPIQTHTITEDTPFLPEHKITKTELIVMIRMIINPSVKPTASRASACVQTHIKIITVCSMLD